MEQEIARVLEAMRDTASHLVQTGKSSFRLGRIGGRVKVAVAREMIARGLVVSSGPVFHGSYELAEKPEPTEWEKEQAAKPVVRHRPERYHVRAIKDAEFSVYTIRAGQECLADVSRSTTSDTVMGWMLYYNRQWVSVMPFDFDAHFEIIGSYDWGE